MSRIQKCSPFSHVFIGFVLMIISVQLCANENVDQSNYDVKFYGLDIHINDSNTFIYGNVTILLEIMRVSDSIVLNLGNNLEVSEVIVDSVLVSYQHINNLLYVPIKNSKINELLSVVVSYSGDGDSPEDRGALFNKENDYGNFTYSLTEPFSTKYWYPCKEVLSDKADSVYVFATVPKGLKVGSNGLLDKVTPIGLEYEQYRWKSYYPTAYYLVSVALGDYLEYSSQVNLSSQVSMPTINYIYNSEDYFNLVKNDVDATDTLLQLFSDKFGLYPFYLEKYGHSQVPIGGGMEHQTMTTLGSFDFALVAHELGHQWFGNYITCTYWNDIWINEGFASYCEFIAFQELYGQEYSDAWMENVHEVVKESNSGSVYVPELEVDDSQRIFDSRLSYKKGAAIIHMIRYELNDDELFFRILKEFLTRHAYSTATAEDFRVVLEELSGLDFTRFFSDWYYGSGYPELSVQWFQSGDMLYVINTQSTSAPDKTPFFHLNLQYKIIYPTGDSIIYHSITEQIDTLKIAINKSIYDLTVDPENYILKEIKVLEKIQSLNSTKGQILLFPNPANDELNLFSRSTNQLVDLSFYNSIGTNVKRIENLSPYGSKVSIDELEAGIYHVYLKSNIDSWVFKLIKK